MRVLSKNTTYKKTMIGHPKELNCAHDWHEYWNGEEYRGNKSRMCKLCMKFQEVMIDGKPTGVKTEPTQSA